MLLILKDNRIIGTATDDYQGPETILTAPVDFDPLKVDRYAVVDNQVIEYNPVPESITMRQARLQLLKVGLLDSVVTTIQNMDGDEGRAAFIEWEYSNTVLRNGSLTNQLATLLNLDSTQVDQMFKDAALL
jgi:hypothetical protein